MVLELVARGNSALTPAVQRSSACGHASSRVSQQWRIRRWNRSSAVDRIGMSRAKA